MTLWYLIPILIALIAVVAVMGVVDYRITRKHRREYDASRARRGRTTTSTGTGTYDDGGAASMASTGGDASCGSGGDCG